MAGSDANLPGLAERVDIHKSCKALEVLVNLLADYTDATGAVVQLQKKLAKALREAAALKATSDVASKDSVSLTRVALTIDFSTLLANAFEATAGLFDVLVDIDVKFSKLMNRECDAVSGDVKKWFKKLAVSTNATCSMNRYLATL